MTTTRWMTVDDGVDVETRIEELEALLKKTQKAVQQARMGYKRKSKAQPPAADAEDDEEADPARLAKAKAANARRVRLSVKAICEELNCREDIAAEVLNVVIIKCSKPVRAALRLHGAMQQERFFGVKHAIRSRRGLCARGGGDDTSISGICSVIWGICPDISPILFNDTNANTKRIIRDIWHCSF